MKTNRGIASRKSANAVSNATVVCHPSHREPARHQEVALRELQHRISNSLQIVASIIAIKARAAHSEETRLQLEDAHRRVLSIATVQHHLDMTGGGRSVEMAPYLSRLCATLAESMIDSGGLVSLTVRAGAGGIAIKQAENIGLIVTELVINALKHAFPAGRGGEVRITYDVAKAGWRLSVSDNGVGGQESDGARMNSGVGTRIVR
ncbi:MAG TPA: sensor histidine kinase, partial [Xanthobacteraceae bacterium]